MAQPLLSIVMAHYEDFHGVYFTIQSLRMQNPELMSKTEFVVVTNSPGKTHSNMVKDFLGSIGPGVAGVKFVEMEKPFGTSPSRNRAIAEATGQYVICLDCHCLLVPGALPRLLKYYEANLQTSDLIHGVLVYDTLMNLSTHFNDCWRAEMWGTWGSAWRCTCGSNQRFWMAEENGQAVPKKLMNRLGVIPYPYCHDCGKTIPNSQWSGHEQVIVNGGFQRQMIDDSPPFPIPGQGMGMFSCRKDAWLGFNEHARGFGGEEMYISEKYRKAGFQALCLPSFGFVHRFGRPDGVPYPLTRFNKVRNYILEFQELGMDLAPVHTHFVASGLMPTEQWKKLESDAIKYETEESCKTCGGGQTFEFQTVGDAFKQLQATPRDLNEHMPLLFEYASKVDHITEIDSRREPTIAFLTARPITLVSYNKEADGLVAAAVKMTPETTYTHSQPDFANPPDIEQTDLLFIDTHHNAEQLTMELGKLAGKVNRFIILHDTAIYGLNGDDGGEGLLKAIHSFVFPNGKPGEWFVGYHTPNQYGLTVLCKRAEDRPDEPVPLVFPETGPGTDLKRILASLDIYPTPECPCNLRAIQMNIYGKDGCEENFDKIVGWLREGAESWGWNDKFKSAESFIASAGMAIKAIWTGLAFKVNWLDPIPSLVRLSINATKT